MSSYSEVVDTLKDYSAQDSATVIGLGKLGFVKAVLLANCKILTYGYDIDSNLIRELSLGVNRYKEKDLDDKFEEAKPWLKLGYGLKDCVTSSSIVYVIVPTPSNPEGDFSNSYVIAVLTEVAEILKFSEHGPTIVICSTVMPGSCEEIFIPLMEKISGKLNGIGFNLVYSPEFIALGNIVFNMQNPDMLLIGSKENQGADLAQKFAMRVVLNIPTVNKISLIDAEISKIAINSFITTKISFANFISEIADKVIGANAHTITRVIGSDTRIGTKYLKPGTSFGGPCFPRDNKAFSVFSNSLSVDPSLPRATDQINARQVERVVDVVKANCMISENIGIIGMSYKESTPVVDESFSFHLLENLTSIGYKVFVFDTIVELKSLNQKNSYLVSDVGELFQNSKCVIFALPYNLASGFDVKNIKGKILIDFWGGISSTDVGDNVLISMGNRIA